MSYGNMPFGLRDVKVTNIGGTVQADLPVAQTLQLRFRLRSGELSGDDALQAIVGYIDAVEWELEEGGIDLDAMAIMTGETVTVTGTTPNEVSTMTFEGGDSMPYFKIYGKSLGDGPDDIHVKLFKAKLTSPPEGRFQDAQFWVTKCAGIALDDGTNGILDVVQNETAAALPSS
jgi:hypothetical protein